MGIVMSFKQLNMEKQYSNFYAKCSNYNFNHSNDHYIIKKNVRDIRKELVSGYIRLLSKSINIKG